MNYVLCYGDSNTWGFNPLDRSRYDFPDRWPGILQSQLGTSWRVYENALNGRTTVFDDPIVEGRNGSRNFVQVLRQNMPLDLVVLMLGVNDTKTRFNQSAWDIGWGMNHLIETVLATPCGRDNQPPEILVVSPARMNNLWGESIHGTQFNDDSIRKGGELADIYKTISERNQCHFLNATELVEASLDGIHLTREHHRILGQAVAQKVAQIFH